MKYLTAACFVGTVYAANWALTTYGVIHLFGGLYAPAGVFFAGDFVLVPRSVCNVVEPFDKLLSLGLIARDIRPVPNPPGSFDVFYRAVRP